MIVTILGDAFQLSDTGPRLTSSYQGHVYFPRELQLLALAAGLAVEFVWGNHERRPLQHTDRDLVLVSRRAVVMSGSGLASGL